jgi:hypothetical protein
MVLIVVMTVVLATMMMVRADTAAGGILRARERRRGISI